MVILNLHTDVKRLQHFCHVGEDASNYFGILKATTSVLNLLFTVVAFNLNMFLTLKTVERNSSDLFINIITAPIARKKTLDDGIRDKNFSSLSIYCWPAHVLTMEFPGGEHMSYHFVWAIFFTDALVRENEFYLPFRSFNTLDYFQILYFLYKMNIPGWATSSFNIKFGMLTTHRRPQLCFYRSAFPTQMQSTTLCFDFWGTLSLILSWMSLSGRTNRLESIFKVCWTW